MIKLPMLRAVEAELLNGLQRLPAMIAAIETEATAIVVLPSINRAEQITGISV